MGRCIVWFRRDLRLGDNTALHAAIDSGIPIIPVFIFDEDLIDELDKGDARLTFIHQQLSRMNAKLNLLGSGLVIRKGKPSEVWRSLVGEYSPTAVFYNRDYEPYARRRDERVFQLLTGLGVVVQSFKDHVVFEPNQLLKDDGKPYTVFTPYKKKWLQLYREVQPLESTLEQGKWNDCAEPFPEIETLGIEKSAISVLAFDLDHIEGYGAQRDYPAKAATTLLGPHLRFGTIGIRELLSRTKNRSEVFLSELIWREFFQQIIFHYPDSATANFRSKYNGIQWRNDPKEFETWCNGATGYPIVDAGMRELNETGYLHNRVRMVVASFLCKHLLIDWRWGEAYFAEKLLDFELASNVGNWQWAAGTGCDAAPYFRVFNPSEQQKKFDPEFRYIKKWVPEFGTPNYPLPMVDHKIARERALEVYKTGIDEIAI